MSDNQHPIALITGGSRGLGRAAALELAGRGIDVIITFNSKSAEADAVVAECEAKGARAAALQLDVRNSGGFGAFAEQVKGVLSRHWDRGQFNFLVNNAGSGVHVPFSQTTEAQFDQMMAEHLKGPFFLTQHLLPLIADGGRILNVSSGLARFSMPGYAAYGTMKGGIEVLTRYLAAELGPRRISVNVLAPGAIATDFGGGAVRDNAQVNQHLASMTALGRVGEADDIGLAIAGLLAGDLRWVNGQRIEVAGGIFL